MNIGHFVKLTLSFRVFGGIKTSLSLAPQHNRKSNPTPQQNRPPPKQVESKEKKSEGSTKEGRQEAGEKRSHHSRASRNFKHMEGRT